jgi:hypothetical protein
MYVDNNKQIPVYRSTTFRICQIIFFDCSRISAANFVFSDIDCILSYDFILPIELRPYTTSTACILYLHVRVVSSTYVRVRADHKLSVSLRDTFLPLKQLGSHAGKAVAACHAEDRFLLPDKLMPSRGAIPRIRWDIALQLGFHSKRECDHTNNIRNPCETACRTWYELLAVTKTYVHELLNVNTCRPIYIRYSTTDWQRVKATCFRACSVYLHRRKTMNISANTVCVKQSANQHGNAG